MRKVSLSVLIVLLAFTSLPLFAQENFTEGAINRIVLIRINPGRTTEFWADIRQNTKPVFEEYKKQGVITDYAFFTKATTENPEDWNVGFQLSYKNYAALDGLGARLDPITLKFYGSAQARADAVKKRTENATVVGSFLIRTVDPKPMTSPAAAPKP